MVDWSALFLTSERGFDAAHAGFGYGVFSITMTVGRFIGDRLVRRFGAETVLILGGLSAAAGFLLAVLGPTAFGALAGFALVGAGASNIVPVLFSAAGRQTAMPLGHGDRRGQQPWLRRHPDRARLPGVRRQRLEPVGRARLPRWPRPGVPSRPRSSCAEPNRP